MKVIGRILYAMLAVFAFWFTFNYAQNRMSYLYFEDKGNEALTYENDAFFYGSARDYSSDEILLEIEEDGYRIAFYEVADVKENTNSIEVTTYIAALLTYDQGIDKNYNITFSNDDEQLTLQFYQFQSLDIAMMLNENNSEYGIDATLLLNGYTSLDLYNEEDTLVLSHDFTITDNQLIIEDEIISYYDQNEALPFDALIDNHIYPKYTHSVSDYLSVLYISIAVYVVVLLLSFYIVFVFRKKYMGRKEPSTYYKKEQKKYIDV